MAARGKNRARNQTNGPIHAPWFTNKKRNNKKLRKAQKASRRQNR